MPTGWFDASLGKTIRALRFGEDARRLGGVLRRALRGDEVVPHGPPAAPPPLLEALLRGDDRRLDIGLAAILLAAEDLGDEVEVERALGELDALAWSLRQRLQAEPRDPERRLGALNRLFFEDAGFEPSSVRESRAGDGRLRDLLLPQVLRRRRGHCVGLSCAYLAIGVRAGLPLFGVSAPGHFFVRWDGEGLRRNIETTARGLAHEDEHYVERFRIAPGLVDRGVYLQSLRRREVLVEVFNNRANFYWDRGDAARATRDLDRIVQVSASFARARVGRGFVSLQRGDLEGARTELERAVDIDPQDGRALLLLGEVGLRRGDLAGAEAALRRAIEADDANPLALTNLGRVHARRGELDQAVEWHRSALRVDPCCLAALNNLGVALRALGEIDEARLAFREAAAIDDEFLPARENLVLLARGEGGGLPLTARPAYRAVKKAYERRLLRDGRDEETRGAYVRFLVEVGRDREQAVHLAREGARQRRSPRALETLAAALERLGDVGGAAAALEEALGIERGRGEVEAATRLERRLESLRAGPPLRDR